ncbi:MAG: tetratricopeptide repeat protein, partial [Acidobacteriota bacterium]
MRFGLLVAGIACVSLGLVAGRERQVTLQASDGRSAPACAQTTALDDLLTRSAAFYGAGDAARGIALLHDALDLATTSRCGGHRAEALRRLALADVYAASYEPAREKLVEAVALFHEAGQALGEAQSLLQLGQVLLKLRRATDAQTALLQARDQLKILQNLPGLFTAYDGLMYAMPAGSGKDEVRADALTLMRASLSGRSFECNVLHQWGDELFGAGAYSASFAKVTEAIACFEEVGDRSKLGRALVSLGRVYRAHGRLEAALTQYERALDAQQRSNDREGVIQTLNALAVTLGFMGRIDAALVRYDEALALARSLGSKPIIQFLLANVAEAFQGLGRNREAADALEEALRDPYVPYKVSRLVQLSGAYLALKRPPLALETADRAVAEMSEARPEEVMEALPARARAAIALGRFDAASEDMQRALATFERLRANTLADDYLKRGFGQRYQSLFATTISLQQAKGSTRDAIETAERARARAFLDLLAERTSARQIPTAAVETGTATGLAAVDQQPSAAPATFADMVGTAARLHSSVV